MKFLNLVLLYFFAVAEIKAQSFFSNKVAVHFFSPAPVIDIDALTNSASATLNIKKKEVKISIPIASFSFKKALMQQHFNEIYLESEKYPTANFKGEYKDNIDFNKDGKYKIFLTGKLNIHGTDKQITLPCNLNIKNNEVVFDTDFKLITKDYKIKLPKILNQEVGQEINVTVNGVLLRVIKNLSKLNGTEAFN